MTAMKPPADGGVYNDVRFPPGVLVPVLDDDIPELERKGWEHEPATTFASDLGELAEPADTTEEPQS